MKMSLSRCVLAAAIAGLAVSSAQAETTLRMAHFWPGPSGVNQDVLQAWADTIEEESNGELTIHRWPLPAVANCRASRCRLNGNPRGVCAANAL